MSRLLPRSLFGQTLLALLVGLIISHVAGSWIYTLDREQAVRAVGGFAAAQRITNLARLVQDTPRESRERIVAALSDQTFLVALSPQPPAMNTGDDDAQVTGRGPTPSRTFSSASCPSGRRGNLACLPLGQLAPNPDSETCTL